MPPPPGSKVYSPFKRISDSSSDAISAISPSCLAYAQVKGEKSPPNVKSRSSDREIPTDADHIEVPAGRGAAAKAAADPARRRKS